MTGHTPKPTAVGLQGQNKPETEDLFPYQKESVEWLSQRKFALLAHEMGLGKTAIAIRAFEKAVLGQKASVRALIICPSVAQINWLREVEMWALDRQPCHVMTQISDVPPTSGHIICSFDYATANKDQLKNTPWDALVIDEAHFLKSHEAKRAKAIMGAEGIIRSAKRVWLMTGTPAPNHPGELWIMLYTFGVTTLSYDAFIRKFCVVRPTTYGLKIVSANPSAIPELRQLLSKIMLRRLKKDVMTQLPPLTYGHVNVTPGPVDVEILPSFTHYFLPTDRRDELKAELERQATLLRTLYDNMKTDKDDKLLAIEAISNSVSTLRRYIGLQKCRDAVEIIRAELEANAYQKIVIFCIHTDVIEQMRIGLRKFGAVVLFGGTNPATRQRNIDRFQTNPKCRVFIGNIHAAGTAITLTAAHNVTFIEQDWVPGNNAQAIMRCHRIGQENHVKVRFILLDGTLDAKIGYILKQKTMHLTHIFD